MYCITLTNGCFVCICYRVPIAVDLIFSKRVFGFFILWSGFCFLLTAVSLSDRLKLWEAGVIIADSVQVPLIIVDSIYYGKFVFAPWNILLYNVFGKGGPNLYGTAYHSSSKW